MSFVHDDAEFDDLLRIVAAERSLSLGLVEKDYWVTHTLWALHHLGLEVWFKGGTSLSKGFGIIKRFSEDLDLKIEPGTVSRLPTVGNWKSDGKKATGEREAFFEALLRELAVPGAQLDMDVVSEDPTHRSAGIRVHYPGRHLGDLDGVLRPFVLLEVGNARATPFARRDLSSFVHDYLTEHGLQRGYDDNRPRGARCVHPIVTLLEKLDHLRRSCLNEEVEPAKYVRHYEDAARIASAEASLPPLDGHASARALADEMLQQHQIRALPVEGDAAFSLSAGPRTELVRKAHAAIGRMFWGERLSLEEACAAIRAWIHLRLGAG